MKAQPVQIITAALAVVSLGIGSAALAAGASEQIATAAKHAGFAAKADNASGVHTHMHHVLNCVVGEGGDGFDASNANPCADQGDGALNDAGSDNPQVTAALERVAELMRTGVQVQTLKPAQQIARAAQGILKQAGGM